MKQITIRDIPSEIEKVVRRESEKKGLSLNRAFISLLEKAVGINAKGGKIKTLHHDLDCFSGIWTEEDEKIFKKSMDFQRKVDEDLWKKSR